MKIDRIVEILNRIAPEGLQESWDNSGIQINDDADKEISRIMTCLEINDDVIDEAVEKEADMIVTHHPLFFSKYNRIDERDVVGRQVIRLIQNGIAVYSSHTAFDSAEHGTNQYLAEKLKLAAITPMEPSAEYPECGMGRYGRYQIPLNFIDFLDNLRAACPDADVRIAGVPPVVVRKVALCTGAGAEFTDEAAAAGADVYVTGDVKYHDARHAYDISFCVIDAGHYGTEILFADNMAALLSAELSAEDGVEIIASQTDINPFS